MSRTELKKTKENIIYIYIFTLFMHGSVLNLYEHLAYTSKMQK